MENEIRVSIDEDNPHSNGVFLSVLFLFFLFIINVEINRMVVGIDIEIVHCINVDLFFFIYVILTEVY